MTANPKDDRTIPEAQRRTAKVNATRAIGEVVSDDPEPKPAKRRLDRIRRGAGEAGRPPIGDPPPDDDEDDDEDDDDEDEDAA